jgi:hypothetical protein
MRNGIKPVFPKSLKEAVPHGSRVTATFLRQHLQVLQLQLDMGVKPEDAIGTFQKNTGLNDISYFADSEEDSEDTILTLPRIAA